MRVDFIACNIHLRILLRNENLTKIKDFAGGMTQPRPQQKT
jgi:hypothetical protein